MIEILTMILIAATSSGVTYAVIERRRRAEHRAFLRHLADYDDTTRLRLPPFEKGDQ